MFTKNKLEPIISIRVRDKRKSNKSDKNNFANVLSYQYAIHWHFMVTENETENMETKKQSGI